MGLKEKILKRKAEIGIVGLGYVGLSLTVEFLRSGFEVYGIDNDNEKVDRMNAGEFPDQEVARSIINPAINSNQFHISQNYDVLAHVDCIIICVPTPLRQTKDPDMRYIMQAVAEVRKYLHRGTLVILESTTYPGTTLSITCSYKALAISVHSEVIPPTTFGVFLVPYFKFPGSTRSGEKARKKSFPILNF